MYSIVYCAVLCAVLYCALQCTVHFIVLYNVLYCTMYCTVHCIVTGYTPGRVGFGFCRLALIHIISRRRTQAAQGWHAEIKKCKHSFWFCVSLIRFDLIWVESILSPSGESKRRKDDTQKSRSVNICVDFASVWFASIWCELNPYYLQATNPGGAMMTRRNQEV